MKSKQLANVLIKILGLSVCVHAAGPLLSGLFNLARARSGAVPGEYWFYPLPSLILAVIGICLIVRSRGVAEFLFKDEAE